MIRFIKKQLKYILSPKYAYLKRFKINKGDIIIDLGANVGEVSEYFLAKGASVYAYEPNPFAFRTLENRTGHHKNIVLHRAAISNFSGTAALFLHEQHTESEVNYSQGCSLHAEKNNVGKDSINVAVHDIKEILGHHDHVKLIKIDIEGGEYEIMDHILNQATKIDHILLETHENKGANFKAKNDALLKKIDKMGLQDKLYLDWF